MNRIKTKLYRGASNSTGQARRCCSGLVRDPPLSPPSSAFLGRLGDRWQCPGDGGESAAQARQELAAVVCVDRFMAASDAGDQLTALKEITTSYAQGKFVADGGWAIIVPASSPTDYTTRTNDSKAAGLCAEEL